MKYSIANVVVKDRKRPLDDISSLVQSIKDLGLLNPITLLPDGTLIAGYHRLEACKSLGWQEIEAHVLEMDALKSELAEIDENLIRNELHWFDRDMQLKRRKEIYENLHPETRKGNTSEKRLLEAVKAVKADNRPLPLSFVQDTSKKTNASVTAVKESIQRATVFTEEQGEILKRAAVPPTDATKLARMEEPQRKAVIQKLAEAPKPLPVKEATRQLKEEEREQRREGNRQIITQAKTIDEALGTAKFSTIVIDPPWDWGDEGDVDQFGRGRPVYGTMSIDELLALPVGAYADKNCHLYLWITNRSLPKGFKLLEQWGFRYVTCVTWVKPSFGMGNYFRGQTEHLLFGVKGSQMLKRKDVGTVLMAPRGPNGHSSKPLASYDLIESCSPGPYLELFARSARTDWTSWGAEA